MAPARARATVRLTLACDNRCVFCAQDGLHESDANDAPKIAARIASARATSDELTFVGGEPTLDPELATHVAAACALGFRRVGLQTNGRRLAEAGYAASLARAGLTDVHLSIHGADARAHDYHTGVDGSFAQVLAGLAAARASGLMVVATTVLTRSSFRVLAPIPKLLASRGVAAWVVAVARTAGRAATASDRVVPRLALAIPFALHALEAADAVGLPAWISGAPACLLGPLASRAMHADERAYGDACAACDARAVCPGVDPDYLARFGGDELAPRATFATSAAHPDLQSIFVGTGELAPPPARAAAPRARVQLPVLGKVKPALAEVAAGTEKKSGDALREILPALFDERRDRRDRQKKSD